MSLKYKNPKERFKGSGDLVRAVLIKISGLQVAVLIAGITVRGGEFFGQAINFLIATATLELALVAAWSGITNWAEVRGMDAGFATKSPDLSKQTVNVNQPAAPPPEE